jgi:hypothetical protein
VPNRRGTTRGLDLLVGRGRRRTLHRDANRRLAFVAAVKRTRGMGEHAAVWFAP